MRVNHDALRTSQALLAYKLIPSLVTKSQQSWLHAVQICRKYGFLALLVLLAAVTDFLLTTATFWHVEFHSARDFLPMWVCDQPPIDTLTVTDER